MELAIEEAEKSKPEDKRVHPKVGVVIIKDGTVIAQGHRGEICAGEHAEYTVFERKLRNVDLDNAILYTTLEPCTVRSHKKLPCAKWIVKRRIKQVVIGMVDPDPRISGKGILYLRGNNVMVDHFPSELQLKIEEQNKDFIQKFKKDLPESENLPVEKVSKYEKKAIVTAGIKDLSTELIKTYCNHINLKIKIPSNALWDFFQKKKFLTINKENSKLVPTVAGLLLFGKNPEIFLEQSIIKAIGYQGFEEGTIIDKLNVKGALSEIINESEKFLMRNMKISMQIEGFSRVEVTEYPVEALREAIRNAVIHRDYAIEGATVMVKKFKDRIVIQSPGELPKPLTLDKIRTLDYSPHSRNPVLARAMNDMIFMEELGTGIRRMHEKMLEHNLKPPEFYYNNGYFTVIFYGPGEETEISSSVRTEVYEINPDILSSLNDRQKDILKFLHKNARIASNDCKTLFNISRETANKDFKELINKDLIVKVGTGRGTYYVLKN